ncbi:hypothetical protein HMPREF3215_00459 [Staphylococcus simulans]|nr:hypothetical protein HMPREF3215_00459 [Staphylococcus simulans]
MIIKINKVVYLLDLESQLAELKQDYVRLQDDLEKRESTGQEVDPLIKQLEQIEHEIAHVRSQIKQQ